MRRRFHHVFVRHLLSFMFINLLFRVLITRTYSAAFLYFNIEPNFRSFLPLFPFLFVFVVSVIFPVITPLLLLDILQPP